ncbi:MAG: nuclear transport factor 2 family protein [Alphaproteobacteria bacterium]|nr:nuclear transport factor 2 family protein [Alphaproteobacteria bacterium]
MFGRNSKQQSLEALDAALNKAILDGNALEAFETYYADDVVMQENDGEPTVGKAANRQREQDFFAAITEFRGAEVLATGFGDGVTFSHWRFDFTHRDWGVRNYRQVAVRSWKDGKVVREVFHYG